MAAFTVRVELHDATESHYEVLHREMASRGFARSVLGSDGKRYQLPTAEYYADSLSSPELARMQAVSAAGATGRTFAVLVTPVAGALYWQGLTIL